MGKRLEKAEKKGLDRKAPLKYTNVQEKHRLKKKEETEVSECTLPDIQGIYTAPMNKHNSDESEALIKAYLKPEKKTIGKKNKDPLPRQYHNEFDKEEQLKKPLYRNLNFIENTKNNPLEKRAEKPEEKVQGDVGDRDEIHNGQTRKAAIKKEASKKASVKNGQARETSHEVKPKSRIQKKNAQGEAGTKDNGSNSYFRKETQGKQRSSKSFLRRIEKLQNTSNILEHELVANYDAEERKKSAAKEYITGKAKGRAQTMAIHAAKKAGKAVLAITKKAAAHIIKWTITIFVTILPFLAMIAATVSLVTVIISGLIYEDQKQGDGGGYFGKMFYWIEYETGKNDETAFSTVLGDGGRAFGIQFDYMYALQPFLRYCHGKNPISYAPFHSFLEVDKSALLGSQALADAWLHVFENNKQDFMEDQKQFAKMNYYDGIEEQAEQFGLKLKTRDEVCKGAVLSYSFQCGSEAAFIAVRELSGVEDDEDFLKKIYQVRTSSFPAFSDRYEREYITAMALFRGQMGGDFVCPVDMNGCMVTSEFGEYRSPSDPAHKGTDFASYGGANVPTYAIADGTVKIAGYSSSAGNWAVIDHGNGMVAKYMHHESIRVAVGQVLRIFDGDELELETVGIKKQALFLIIPDDDSTYNFVVGMLYTQLFQTLYRVARSYKNRLPVPVGFWMDEFANTKMPNDFEKILSTCRSRNIYIVIILQSLAQLKTLYPNDAHEGILGNCDTFVYLGGNEKSSQKYVSETLGKWTIDKRTNNQTLGKQGSVSVNNDILGRELMTEDEVSMLGNHECIVKVRGIYPIRDDKCYWFNIPEYSYVNDLPTYQTDVLVRKEGNRLVTVKYKSPYKLLSEDELKEMKENGETVIHEFHPADLLMMDIIEEELKEKERKEFEETGLQLYREINLEEMDQEIDERQKELKEKSDREGLSDLLENYSYSDGQMEVILEALQEGMPISDISRFADPERSVKQMRYMKELIHKAS